MTGNAYFSKLEKDLAEGVQSILMHPYIEKIRSASLTKKELQFFIGQYYYLSQHYPRFLAAVGANIPDDETRIPVVNALWKEHGQGKIFNSNRNLYKRYASAAGLSEMALMRITPLSTTQIVTEHIFHVCKDQHFLEGLGALGPGPACFIPTKHSIIFEGLSKYDYFRKEDLVFWTSHVFSDEKHYEELIAAMLPWTHSAEYRHLIQMGASRVIDLEIMFWDGLNNVDT